MKHASPLTTARYQFIERDFFVCFALFCLYHNTDMSSQIQAKFKPIGDSHVHLAPATCSPHGCRAQGQLSQSAMKELPPPHTCKTPQVPSETHASWSGFTRPGFIPGLPHFLENHPKACASKDTQSALQVQGESISITTNRDSRPLTVQA